MVLHWQVSSMFSSLAQPMRSSRALSLIEDMLSGGLFERQVRELAFFNRLSSELMSGLPQDLFLL
jgi:hypothetical protein